MDKNQKNKSSNKDMKKNKRVECAQEICPTNNNQQRNNDCK